jgi:DNA-binding MarR family transcriptional regulator
MGQDLSPQFHAWYGMLQAGLRTLDKVERDVEEGAGIPLAWFEVLAFLQMDAGEGGGRRRMSELADNLLLSRGGATRLIARMEEAGLVVREVPPDDRRATFAVITPDGQAAFERAKPVQADAVERHFAAAVGEEEAEVVRAMSVRVLTHLDATCAWLERDAERQVGAADR